MTCIAAFQHGRGMSLCLFPHATSPCLSPFQLHVDRLVDLLQTGTAPVRESLALAIGQACTAEPALCAPFAETSVLPVMSGLLVETCHHESVLVRKAALSALGWWWRSCVRALFPLVLIRHALLLCVCVCVFAQHPSWQVSRHRRHLHSLWT